MKQGFNRQAAKKAFSIFQQGFIVATLGSLFVFGPLQTKLSAREAASKTSPTSRDFATHDPKNGSLILWLGEKSSGTGQGGFEVSVRR